MADLQMEDVAPDGDISKGPSFSDEEKEILELYDQVQKLELEVALAKARVRLTEEAEDARHDTDDQPQGDDPRSVEEARSQLLEASSLLTLRNGVTTNVLIANPLLRGIHGSTAASPIEQDIPPWVEARDAASRDVAAQSAAVRDVLARLTDTEAEVLRAARRNRGLAEEVLRLAREADRRGGGEGAEGGDTAAEAQVAELEGRLAASRQKWRVMKGTASGIVAGSGVDWAADPVLRDVVLDPE